MNKEDTTIERLSKQDITTFVELISAGFPYIIDKIIYGCTGISNFVEQNLDNNTYAFFVAKLNDKLIGCAEYRVIGNTVFLNYIAIHDELRRQGIASYIFDNTLSLLPKHEKILLDVFSSNTAAINLYENNGFKYVDTSTWYKVELPIFSYSDSYKIINSEANKEHHHNFGFSMFEFSDGVTNYSVGLIGDRWIRVTDIAFFENIDLLRFVKSNFDKRDIFAILKNDINKYSDDVLFEQIIQSKKMER